MKKYLVVTVLTIIAVLSLAFLGCRQRSLGIPGVEPTATFTPTPPPYFLYYFLDSPAAVSAWTCDAGMTISYTTSQAYSGTGCAKVDYNMTGTTSIATFRANITVSNFTGKTITTHVYVPAALHAADYQMQVWFMTSGYSWHNSTYDLNSAGVTPDAWNTFVFTPVGVGEGAVGSLGVQLEKNGQADISGSFYVDEVIVN